MRAVLSLCVLMAVCFLAPAHVRANDIAATVNEHVITKFEVAQRQKLMALSRSKGSAVQDIIDDKIKLSAARKLGLVINDAEVDAAFSNIARGSKMSPEQFTKALSTRGVQPQTLKDRVRAELTWRQLVQARFTRSQPIQTKEDAILANFTYIGPNGAEKKPDAKGKMSKADAQAEMKKMQQSADTYFKELKSSATIDVK